MFIALCKTVKEGTLRNFPKLYEVADFEKEFLTRRHPFGFGHRPVWLVGLGGRPGLASRVTLRRQKIEVPMSPPPPHAPPGGFYYFGRGGVTLCKAVKGGTSRSFPKPFEVMGQYCAILYCAVLQNARLHRTAQHCTVYSAQYCAILYSTALRSTVLCSTVHYCTVLYTVDYCTVQ